MNITFFAIISSVFSILPSKNRRALFSGRCLCLKSISTLFLFSMVIILHGGIATAAEPDDANDHITLYEQLKELGRYPVNSLIKLVDSRCESKFDAELQPEPESGIGGLRRRGIRNRPIPREWFKEVESEKTVLLLIELLRCYAAKDQGHAFITLKTALGDLESRADSGDQAALKLLLELNDGSLPDGVSKGDSGAGRAVSDSQSWSAFLQGLPARIIGKFFRGKEDHASFLRRLAETHGAAVSVDGVSVLTEEQLIIIKGAFHSENDDGAESSWNWRPSSLSKAALAILMSSALVRAAGARAMEKPDMKFLPPQYDSGGSVFGFCSVVCSSDQCDVPNIYTKSAGELRSCALDGLGEGIPVLDTGCGLSGNVTQGVDDLGRKEVRVDYRYTSEGKGGEIVCEAGDRRMMQPVDFTPVVSKLTSDSNGIPVAKRAATSDRQKYFSGTGLCDDASCQSPSEKVSIAPVTDNSFVILKPECPHNETAVASTGFQAIKFSPAGGSGSNYTVDETFGGQGARTYELSYNATELEGSPVSSVVASNNMITLHGNDSSIQTGVFSLLGRENGVYQTHSYNLQHGEKPLLVSKDSVWMQSGNDRLYRYELDSCSGTVDEQSRAYSLNSDDSTLRAIGQDAKWLYVAREQSGTDLSFSRIALDTGAYDDSWQMATTLEAPLNETSYSLAVGSDTVALQGKTQAVIVSDSGEPRVIDFNRGEGCDYPGQSDAIAVQNTGGDTGEGIGKQCFNGPVTDPGLKPNPNEGVNINVPAALAGAGVVGLFLYCTCTHGWGLYCYDREAEGRRCDCRCWKKGLVDSRCRESDLN